MSKIDPNLRLPPNNHNYQIFNSHCHLNDEKEYEHAFDLIKEGQKFNVTDFIVIGSNQIFNDRAVQLSQNSKHCYCAVGWHPEYWSQYQDIKLLNCLKQPNLVSLVGEIGLDYHYSIDDKLDQQRIFSSQLDIAKQYNLPVSIHTRDAFEDTLQILKDHHIIRGVIHNFNQGPKQAEAFIEQGFMLSISGVITFKNAQDLRESLKIIPDKYLLVETDDPYLTPVPFRGKSNHPAYAYFTLKYIAEYLNIELKELAAKIYQNTERLINGQV